MALDPQENFLPKRRSKHPFPMDVYLRNNGFSIYSRPHQGPVLWVRSGVVYEQEEALGLVQLAEDSK